MFGEEMEAPLFHSRRFAGLRGPIGFLALGLLASTGFAAERITYGEVASKALGRTLPVAVVAPEKPSAAGDTPVLFFLHGRGRNHRSLLDAEVSRTALLTAPFYVVLPQGEDGWYIDSPAKPADRYAAYLDEVMAWAESHLPIAHGPAGRGIVGWSMGGYGAVRFAEANPGRFGFVAGIIALLDYPRETDLPEGQNYNVVTARFTGDPAVWARFNPINQVDALRGTALTLVLATKGFELTMNENFLAVLADKKMPVRVHRLEGGHEFPLVQRAVPLVLADAAEFFQKKRPTP